MDADEKVFRMTEAVHDVFEAREREAVEIVEDRSRFTADLPVGL